MPAAIWSAIPVPAVLLRHTHRRDETRDDDRAGALHVVVEDAVVVAVPIEDAARVLRAEVLEVQDRSGEERSGDGHVPVDELVVAVSAHPGMPVPQVGRVVQQRRVVRPAVEAHGDDPRGVDAGSCRVDGELPDGDVDAVDAPVADAEDLLGVGADDQVDVVGAVPEGPERGFDVLDPVDREVGGL
jgi:hypothetical protein